MIEDVCLRALILNMPFFNLLTWRVETTQRHVTNLLAESAVTTTITGGVGGPDVETIIEEASNSR